MHFCKNAGRGYMKTVEFVNICWSYLFSGVWYRSFDDVLHAIILLVVLVPVTPVVYLCVAPVVAFLEGTKEEEEQ